MFPVYTVKFIDLVLNHSRVLDLLVLVYGCCCRRMCKTLTFMVEDHYYLPDLSRPCFRHTHTHTLISEHNFLSVRIVSMTMRRSECINASPDKQWSFTKTRGSLRQLVKSMLRVSSLIKASPLRPDTVSIPAGPWRHAPMIGLKCLSVRQLSWTNDSLCCLLDWHDNLILWARQGKSDLGAFYWGWGKLTRADKSLPWAINRIKEQQQRQTLLPPSVFF